MAWWLPLEGAYVAQVLETGIYWVRLSNLEPGICMISRVIKNNMGLLRYGCWGASACNTIPGALIGGDAWL